MTTSDWRKAFQQLRAKPTKLAKYKKHNAPNKRSCGISQRKCVRCGRIRAHVGKYGINMCRQCFRETAPKIGFKKFN